MDKFFPQMLSSILQFRAEEYPWSFFQTQASKCFDREIQKYNCHPKSQMYCICFRTHSRAASKRDASFFALSGTKYETSQYKIHNMKYEIQKKNTKYKIRETLNAIRCVVCAATDQGVTFFILSGTEEWKESSGGHLYFKLYFLWLYLY